MNDHSTVLSALSLHVTSELARLTSSSDRIDDDEPVVPGYGVRLRSLLAAALAPRVRADEPIA
ncbi:hypothetical protein CLV56_3724 [Mumia flava]|uniref:Uncharacterized protein n=1 Tax=Mumia flava TaxID=1348852 RepID=A0A0B2BMG1_9ACTN|nr:hypothetical protein [Mumia flava]PJJ54216.1 hypothetical protein CLV56_3724 [Mumia flava]